MVHEVFHAFYSIAQLLVHVQIVNANIICAEICINGGYIKIYYSCVKPRVNPVAVIQNCKLQDFVFLKTNTQAICIS